MIGARAMSKIFTVVILAALPALVATPGFARVHDGAAITVDTDARAPFAPAHATPASGFGRLAPDSVIECFGSCDAGTLR